MEATPQYVAPALTARRPPTQRLINGESVPKCVRAGVHAEGKERPRVTRGQPLCITFSICDKDSFLPTFGSS